MAISYQFPKDFWWGAATSAYQIEGAVDREGRKPSVWDSFSARPGRVLNGDTGTIACDHYDRYPEDVKLMADLGIRHYRFSLSWSRVLPDGRGAVNEAGIDFYRRLVDCLLHHGITPHATLFHWDSPQALEDLYGSWRSRQMADDFADYATAVVSRLGDRITHWMTLNEISCFTQMGYSVSGDGASSEPVHAPGSKVSHASEVWQTCHHALLAHGLGCQAIRAASPQPCSVALVDNFAVPVPIAESPDHIAAAQTAFRNFGYNGGILLPALTGAYDRSFAEAGAAAPQIQDGDLAIIHQPLDALGFNIYCGTYVRAAETAAGFESVQFAQHHPKLNMPWLFLQPESLYWGVRHISETLGLSDLPIFISENGCAAADEADLQGNVIDTDRILYLRQYLQSAHRAVNEGYLLKGYFAWSLLDNFEWSLGYDRRFGLVRVDFPTQQRIPKSSAAWYAECIRQNRAV